MNCLKFCPYRKECRMIAPNCEGEEGLSHNDCPIAWKIEDIIMDAEIAEEDGNDLPFTDDDYDGPEVLE